MLVVCAEVHLLKTIFAQIISSTLFRELLKMKTGGDLII